ncbi:hypothetical protein [Saccharicrinis sp. FJH54]|uniref:hypothetical protein n=1 Tax=Saccharicrinis sp. FJH54 TaxID=3344665 RepID=UPI0035D4C185
MSLTATVLPRKSAAHPFEAKADQWHAERRREAAWDAADAEWGRVALQTYDGSSLNGTTEFWTAAEVARLLGVPVLLLEALAPADRREDGNVYDPSIVAAAMTEIQRLRRLRQAK